MSIEKERKLTGTVVPVRGRPVLMIHALKSILNGSVLPVKIIVALDGTGFELQNDREALTHFLKTLPVSQRSLIDWFETGGLGVALARNHAMQRLDTPLISFLDSDDLWLKNKLERQLQYLSRRPHLIGCQTLEVWQKNGRILSQPAKLIPSSGRMIPESLANCMISPSAVILKRDAVDSSGWFDPAYPVCEDYELWLRLQKIGVIGLLAEKLVIKQSGNWEQLSSGHSLDLFRSKAILSHVDQWKGEDRESARLEVYRKLKTVRDGSRKRGLVDPTEELFRLARQIFEA